MNNLCQCYQKDSGNITTMIQASTALGKCINSVDTVLRNKAMKEKNIFKTDSTGLIQFEKIFAIDLFQKCASFYTSMEKISNGIPKKTPAKLPIVDTIAKKFCSCLESKGESGTKSIVVANINDCLKSSFLKNFDEVIKQYNITEDNQEMLSGIGDLVTKLVTVNCKFYLEKINPILIKK